MCIRDRYKKYQKNDYVPVGPGINETSMPNVDSKDRKVIKDRAKTLFTKDLKGTVRGVNEGKTWKDFKRTIDTVRGKKQEMPKPKRADDAGARARRALKRKEYQAKVSVIVPPELEEGAAWTKKSGKNPSGGLNEKGRKSYERDNPGSDLKAPSKKVGNKRRSSFCARMKGMKKKLTSAKTANDPDSRINKSLRAWNC